MKRRKGRKAMNLSQQPMDSQNKCGQSDSTPNTTRGTLTLQGTPVKSGESFEILAITAGEGNGWVFSRETLMAATPLFNQVHCFIDHEDINNPAGHSIRDLAGILNEPVWDEALQGVRCHLKPLGPAADLLIELGKQTLSVEKVNPNVGFSADLSFTHEGNKVLQILHIYSVDLVADPARGGAFTRVLNNVIKKAKPTIYPIRYRITNRQFER